MPPKWDNMRGGEKSGAAGTNTPSPSGSKNMRNSQASGATASSAQASDNQTFTPTPGQDKAPRETSMSQGGKGGNQSGGGKM